MELSNNYKKDKKRKATMREVVEEEEKKNSCKVKMQNCYTKIKNVKKYFIFIFLLFKDLRKNFKRNYHNFYWDRIS